MKKISLPVGITVNDRPIYYNDKDTDKSLLDLDESSIERPCHAIIKKRSIKGRAFKQTRAPSKIQRVSETIIYTKERIRKMELEPLCEKNLRYMEEYYDTAPLANMICAAIGSSMSWKTLPEIVDIINNVGKGIKAHRAVPRGNVSYHLSKPWTQRRMVAIFIERRSRAGIPNALEYRMNKYGLASGLSNLMVYRVSPIPGSFNELRLKVSELRLCARSNNISEDDYNAFLKRRYEEMTGKTVKTAPEPDRAKPEKTMDAIKQMPVVPKETPVIRPAVSSTDLENYSKVLTGTKPPKKIKIDLKIWFIPVTGEIELT